MTSATMGRRETKRRETRDALVASATKLFSEDGYQATTVVAIAAAAGVSPRTFFGYFPTKEAVLFAPIEAIVEDIEVELQNAEGFAFDIVRAWAARSEPWFSRELPAIHALLTRVSCEDDALALRGVAYVERAAMAVARRLRTEMDCDPDDALPEMAALATIAAFAAILPTRSGASRPTSAERMGPRMLADLDTAIAFARAGLEATRPTSST